MFVDQYARGQPNWTNRPEMFTPTGSAPNAEGLARVRAMTGVGLDLLEIDRLAEALSRRPRLAERLFTDGERAFAAERGGRELGGRNGRRSGQEDAAVVRVRGWAVRAVTRVSVCKDWSHWTVINLALLWLRRSWYET